MKPPAAIARGEEPPMFLQRPSTGKSQDVRHILAKTFRQLYTRDTISPDTVKNLSVSKGGDDEYHERYVEMLQKVHSVELGYLKHRSDVLNTIDMSKLFGSSNHFLFE